MRPLSSEPPAPENEDKTELLDIDFCCICAMAIEHDKYVINSETACSEYCADIEAKKQGFDSYLKAYKLQEFDEYGEPMDIYYTTVE